VKGKLLVLLPIILYDISEQYQDTLCNTPHTQLHVLECRCHLGINLDNSQTTPNFHKIRHNYYYCGSTWSIYSGAM